MSRLSERALSLLGLPTDFHELTLPQRVWISQGPLVLTVALLCIIYAALLPQILVQPMFQAGLAALVLISAAAALIPWDRLWYPTYWILPTLDFVAIGLLYNGSQGLAVGVYLLSVFPVFWLS